MTTMSNKPLVDENGKSDLTVGGQLGWATNLKELAHSTPYIQQPPRIHLTRAPGWMLRHKDKDNLIKILVALVEQHAKSWTGFETNSDISTQEVEIGKDGQKLVVPVNRTRSNITPTAAYDTKDGASDVKFWRYYLDTAISHPEMNGPNLAELLNIPDSWSIEEYTFDVLVYEESTTGKAIVWSMACAGLWPSTDIPVAMDRVVADGRKAHEYTMTFPCVYQDGPEVDKAALKLSQSLKVNSINPNLKPSYFDEVDSRIVGLNAGILAEINKAVKSQSGPVKAAPKEAK